MKPYRFLPEADTELQEHIRYYDQQTAGLGDRFLADVENVLSHIRRYPRSGALLSRRLRKRVLTVFRHNILYFDASDEIIIVAVAPHSRRPGYWLDRLKNLR